MANPFQKPADPFTKPSSGGTSYANPSGKGGVEVSPSGQKKSVGYVSGGGGIYTPSKGTEDQNRIDNVSLTKDTGTGYNPATRVQEGTTAKDISTSKLPTIQSSGAAITSKISSYDNTMVVQPTLKERWANAGNAFNTMGSSFAALFSYKKRTIPDPFSFSVPQQVTTGGEFKFSSANEFAYSKAMTGGLPQEAYNFKLGETISKDLQPKYQGKVVSGEYSIDTSGYLTGKGLEDYNKEFSSIASSKMAVSSKAYGTIGMYGSRIKDYGGAIGTGVSTAGLIGASIVSPPLAALGFSTTVGLGGTKIIKGAAGNQLPFSERAMNIGGGVVESGLGLAGLKYGVIEPLRNQITMASIKGAFEQTPRFNVGEITPLEGGKIRQVYKSVPVNYGGATKLTKIDILSTPAPGMQGGFYSTGKVTNLVEASEWGTGRLIQAGSQSKIYSLGYTYPKPSGSIYSSVAYGKSFKDFEFITKYKTIGISDSYKANIKQYTSSKPIESLTGGVSGKQGNEVWQASGKITDIYFAKGKMGYAFKTEDFARLKLKEAPKEFLKGGLSGEQVGDIYGSKVVQTPTFVNELAKGNTGFTSSMPRYGNVIKSVPSSSLSQRSYQEQSLNSFSSKSLSAANALSFSTSITSAPVTKNIPKSFAPVIPGQYQPTMTKQEVIPALKFAAPTASMTQPSPSFAPSFSMPPVIPWLPNFNFDTGGVSKRGFKGKTRYKYTPSYEAFVFNIKGKMPKGMETGARIRPITRGFSLAYKSSPISFGGGSSGFKMPKFNSGFKFKMPNFGFGRKRRKK